MSLAAFQFGYDLSYYSGKHRKVIWRLSGTDLAFMSIGILAMQPFLKIYGTFDPLKKVYVMSAAHQSLTSSIINAGEFVGAVSSYYVIDKLGRRGGLFVSSGTVVVGTIIQVASTHIGSLIAGRLVLGYAVGLISCVVPTYVADCAPARFRGALVSMYQYCIGLGLLLGVIVDYCTKDRTDTGSFRIPIAVQFVFPLILIPGLLFWIPESPRWLISKGRASEARVALIRLNGNNQEKVDREMIDLEQFAVENERGGPSSWLDLLKWGPEGRKAWLGFSLQALQQATGINFVTGYGIVFFFAVGIENPFLIQLGLYLVAMPAVWFSQFAIERYGRRPILLASGILTATVLIIMGSCGLIANKTKPVEQVIVVMVYLFIIVFNLGWGPTVWVVTSEISTGKNRGKLMSLSTGSNWAFNWLVSFTFPYLFNSDGANLGARIGFLYGCLTLFAVVWVFFYLPETSGRSLEEIETMFQEHVSVKQFQSGFSF
ncbi:general substrate transporter [Aureobasidium pullulans]|nr:general substrate transporter [Aureobasidium pullulans]